MKKFDIQSIQVSMYPKKTDIHVSKYPCIQVSMISKYPLIQVSKKNQYPRYPSIRISEKSGIHSSLFTSSVQPKPGFGIGNRNQDQVSVSVSGPELFLPKPKLSPIWKIYQKIISVMTWKIKNSIQTLKMIQIFKIPKEMRKLTSLSCYKWSLEITSNCFITDWHDTY